MESSCEIIELYGLPGCGKTTLCEVFKKQFSLGDACDINDMFREASSLPLIKKIRLVPINVIIPLIRLWLTCPVLSFNKRGIYRAFLKRIVVISYIKKQRKYHYAILDHGIVQCTHSLFLGREKYFTKVAMQRLLDVIKSLPKLYLIHCEVPVDTAIKRIKERKAIGHGRIDAIKDDILLKDIMLAQEVFFTKIDESLSVLGISLKIDMSADINDLSTHLLYMLENKE